MVAIKCLSLLAAGSAQWHWPQITPKYGAISFGTQRIESIANATDADSFQFVAFRFIYHLSLEIEIAFRLASATQRNVFELFRFTVLCFCFCFVSVFVFVGLFFAIGAIAPGNHCQQLMKAIVGVAAF